MTETNDRNVSVKEKPGSQQQVLALTSSPFHSVPRFQPDPPNWPLLRCSAQRWDRRPDWKKVTVFGLLRKHRGKQKPKSVATQHRNDALKEKAAMNRSRHASTHEQRDITHDLTIGAFVSATKHAWVGFARWSIFKEFIALEKKSNFFHNHISVITQYNVRK